MWALQCCLLLNIDHLEPIQNDMPVTIAIFPAILFYITDVNTSGRLI